MAVVPQKNPEAATDFVKVPWTWVERLAKARYVPTYRVALHLLYRHWKGEVSPSRCLTEVAMEGVSRWQNGAPWKNWNSAGSSWWNGGLDGRPG